MLLCGQVLSEDLDKWVLKNTRIYSGSPQTTTGSVCVDESAEERLGGIWKQVIVT